MALWLNRDSEKMYGLSLDATIAEALIWFDLQAGSSSGALLESSILQFLVWVSSMSKKKFIFLSQKSNSPIFPMLSNLNGYSPFFSVECSRWVPIRTICAQC